MRSKYRRATPEIPFLLKFSQINDNIPYLLAAQKRIIFILKFLCASHPHWDLPLPYNHNHN